MKKLLLIALFAFTALTSRAQIEDGSVAPDFTATDIYGVTHKLSDYLAQGKTVIMDISATWCSPCWDYHNSGALEELYYTLGQGGSQEVVVLFVEGDNQTSVECLYGISPQNLTWGNWVEHSSFPIVDSAAIAQLYQLNYFPTIFRICPDGIVNEIDQLDREDLVANIAANCGSSMGIQKNAKPKIKDLVVCDGGAIMPQATITNLGSEAITTATLQLFDGETLLATKNFTGSIASFDESTVTFDPFEIATGDNYTAKITSINGNTPFNAATTTSHFAVTEVPEANNNITVNVMTDLFPGEISWAIKNSTGTVVAQGGPYQAGPGMSGGGGPDAHTTKVHQVILPGNAPDCYSVELYDSFGDGWGQAPYGIEIWSGSEKIFGRFGSDLKSELIVLPAFKANGLLNNPLQDKAHFTLYPNPSKGILNFEGVENASIIITDMTGKIVYKTQNIESGNAIDISFLQKGVYMATIKTDTITTTQKIILN